MVRGLWRAGIVVIVVAVIRGCQREARTAPGAQAPLVEALDQRSQPDNNAHPSAVVARRLAVLDGDLLPHAPTHTPDQNKFSA
jgi:hypothetical protein